MTAPVALPLVGVQQRAASRNVFGNEGTARPRVQTTPKFPLRWGIIKRILFGMYEFDEQPSRGVAESDLLTMGGHVLISQDLRRFDTVGFSSHRCNQNSDAVCLLE